MKRLAAVIGSVWGDEGKGAVVDYLSSPDTLVVRFNGGGQAGHTVVTPEGQRHVFHHVGSGAFRGATTYLSQYFLVNPIIYLRETAQLRVLGLNPAVYISASCPVTTPWDMMLNQAVEAKRGADRHGSCGVGIHETVVRHTSPFGTKLTYGDLCWLTPGALRARLNEVRSQWGPSRMKRLGLEPSDVPLFCDDRLLAHFIEDVGLMVKGSLCGRWDQITDHREVVFEGAQGLRLDMDSPDFPHVTCSHTGLTNVLAQLGNSYEDVPLEVYYVTRTYWTRHGAGPFPTEVAEPPYAGVCDATNVCNTYQGPLRYGWPDVDAWVATVRADLGKVAGRPCQSAVVVTCVDQLDADRQVVVVDGGSRRSLPVEEFAQALVERAGLGGAIFNSGPTRQTLR